MEAATKGHYRLAGREFPKVNWLTDPGLRRNYICLMFVVITSATNGYDGSMMNGLQALKIWQSGMFENTSTTMHMLTISRLPLPVRIFPGSAERHHVCRFSCCSPSCPLHRRRARSPRRYPYWLYHHDHRSRRPVCRHEAVYVYWSSFPDR